MLPFLLKDGVPVMERMTFASGFDPELVFGMAGVFS
jgi:hypothetical protein